MAATRVISDQAPSKWNCAENAVKTFHQSRRGTRMPALPSTATLVS
jgi:hypothetical protein